MADEAKKEDGSTIIRVRAIDLGYYGKGKEGHLRYPGDEFDIELRHFSDANKVVTRDDGNDQPIYGWMERIEPVSEAAQRRAMRA